MLANIEKIISGNEQEIEEALQKFVENNASVFKFEELNQNSYRTKVWEALFSYIADSNLFKIHKMCLTSIRILSREKTGLETLITSNRINLLLKIGNFEGNIQKDEQYEVKCEALKCLCNIIFNCRDAAKICSENNSMEEILTRLNFYKNSDVLFDISVYDLKILFLISALCQNVRPSLKKHLDNLVELLDYFAKSEDPNKDLRIDLLCEMLKVLFNVTVQLDGEDVDYTKLCLILITLLDTENVENVPKQAELNNQVVNLLTNVPISQYTLLVKEENNQKNMTVIDKLLDYLSSHFDGVNIKNQSELLSPILTVLLKAAKSDRDVRRYLRKKILPPLRDVHNRPEEGDTIRNSLCRLLTSVITEVRDLTADLLFIMCKENVGRMIKYTGYGNAAGLFAQRGLLGGATTSNEIYSSDSEDSDTEEYAQHKHGINPVIGCYEAPHPKVTENMTDEQKEYEVMKLVDLMDSLTRKGVIQPCRIGEDGKPEPIEHVMQLQETLKEKQIYEKRDHDEEF